MGHCIEQVCDAGTCDPSSCIRSSIGLKGCETCIAAESACVLEFCNSACGAPGSDEECRACTCEAGCVSRFDSCSEMGLDVCRGVHGRDATDAEFKFEGPRILRMKGATGLFQTGPMTPQPLTVTSAFPFTAHLSEGFTHAMPFVWGDRQYVLQHKSRCGNDPCVARISPVLSDGSLGHPLYEENWSRGWDELEVFVLEGKPYLLRYKTGAAETEAEAAGHLRIEWMRFDEARTSLALDRVLDQANAPINAPTWSAIETFELGGLSYLFRFGNERGGEIELLRLDRQADHLVITSVAKGLHWSTGWDRFESFTHTGQAYIVAGKSGYAIPSTVEASGSVTIRRIVKPSENIWALASAFDGTWESGIDRIAPFEYAEAAYLLTYSTASANLVLRKLGPDASAWDEDLALPLWTGRWAANPVWSIVEVLQGPQATTTP
ncbi:MAG: hypothetical protein QM778_37195 [Myxococcales bacterium]